MKVGAENKKELMVMLVLLAIAIPVVLYSFRDQIFGSASAANASFAPTAAPSAKTGAAGKVHDSDDPRFRWDILEASRRVKYEAGGRDIFRMEAVPVPTPIKMVKARPESGPPAPPTPTPTPPPPPIPLTYYGYASRPLEPKRIFMQKTGEGDVFVAAQGDIVARRYKIVQIQPTSVTMEDVITGNRQQIYLTPAK